MAEQGSPEAPLERPDGLGPRASRLWDRITGEFQLRADEAEVLEDACRTLDIVVRMEAELAVGPLWVRGSQGQEVANPISSELRQHRALFIRQMGALHLPVDEDDAAGRRTMMARELGKARWRKAG